MYLICSVIYVILALIIFIIAGKWMVSDRISGIDRDDVVGLFWIFGVFWPVGIIVMLCVLAYDACDELFWAIARWFNKR